MEECIEDVREEKNLISLFLTYLSININNKPSIIPYTYNFFIRVMKRYLK